LIDAALKPRGPYSFRLSSRLAGDATRVVRDGRLTAVFELDGRLARAWAWQRPEGTVCVRADSVEAIERLRFVLALDDDHSRFLERFARDPLLGASTRHLRGLRPWRLATVAQALLRALCGQLIQAKRARAIERTIVRAATPREPTTGLHAPPSAAALARFAPAELRALGLGTRRGGALARLCRSFDLERLHALPTDAAAARLERERGLGPWSVGVVCLQGLGRTERGLVGDLGLIKLCSALRGRWAEAWETEELLAPYGEWAGLASVYLLAGWHQGLVPVPVAAGTAA
jgi:3-methyladenine DNA glycosylase/8-oxoguanine DNA glycosylase